MSMNKILTILPVLCILFFLLSATAVAIDAGTAGNNSVSGEVFSGEQPGKAPDEGTETAQGNDPEDAGAGVEALTDLEHVLGENPTEESTDGELTQGGPLPEEAFREEPASEEPASEEPASEEPASEEPASEEPASEEPASEPATQGSNTQPPKTADAGIVVAAVVMAAAAAVVLRKKH